MRVGVLGSMVWDRIEHPDSPMVERWGGISYSLAAAAAATPAGWSIRPVIKVGRDLEAEARAFLRSVPGLLMDGVVTVPEPNNRVHLEYRDRTHRHETLTGGVPGWTWAELAPLVRGLDALFVNLISGFELDLDTARGLRDAFPGFLYADLHSLLLGPAPAEGPRRPRPLDRPDGWLACFDAVQVNEVELRLVAPDGEDAEAFAADAVAGGRPPVLFVTRAERGATWMAAAGDGAVMRGDVPASAVWPAGDPTGCGDVWGATCFVELVRGVDPAAAAARANVAAAWNVAHRGADGLYEHLREHVKGDV